MHSEPLPAGYELRPALNNDLAQVMALLAPFVRQRILLHRTETETAGLLPTGFVVEHAGQIVGFSSVEIYSNKLSEIQCLAVDHRHQKMGLGGQLVQRCLELARERGVMEVMAISSSEQFLRDLGFDYSLPEQKRALFYQIRHREDLYEASDEA